MLPELKAGFHINFSLNFLLAFTDKAFFFFPWMLTLLAKSKFCMY